MPAISESSISCPATAPRSRSSPRHAPAAGPPAPSAPAAQGPSSPCSARPPRGRGFHALHRVHSTQPIAHAREVWSVRSRWLPRSAARPRSPHPLSHAPPQRDSKHRPWHGLTASIGHRSCHGLTTSTDHGMVSHTAPTDAPRTWSRPGPGRRARPSPRSPPSRAFGTRSRPPDPGPGRTPLRGP